MSEILQVDEHSFDNLSDTERSGLITELELFNTQVTDGLKEDTSVINKMFFSSQKDIFQHWAESLEKLHYLGVYKESVSTISEYMRLQISKIVFSEDDYVNVDRKETLNDNMKHYLDRRFKRSYLDKGTESPKDSSPITDDHQFLLDGLQMFSFYHRRFADISDNFIQKLQDSIVFKDFESVTEWEEIALFSHYLNEIASKDGLLDQIENEINVKESATLLQKAMFSILYADGGYRQMAYKFGISTRQTQRVRARLSGWPKKRVRDIIMKIQSSYLCPCGCGYNIVTGKKYHDITNDNFFPKFRWSDKKIKLPDNLKNKRLGPIDIARLIWGKKTKLIITKINRLGSK